MLSVFNRSAIFFGLLLLAGCVSDPETQPEALFKALPGEITGIDFENTLNLNEDWNIIEYLYYYNGGGVSAGDIDNDGLIDLYFTSNEGSNKLYKNLGDFKFEDITEAAGVTTTGWSTGTTMADVNGDGWLDIYVCQVGNYKNQKGSNKLFINNQDGTFSESAEAYGLSFSGLSTQSAFFDYDADGDLDMYLLNHSVHSVESYGPASLRNTRDDINGDRLYRNLAETGETRFEDVTKESGIYSSNLGYGLGVAVLDYNRDGWPDLYISNDFHENDYLYRNEGDGTFMDLGEEVFGHTSRYSMGNDAADINHDGYPEVLTLDMLPGDGRILRKSAAEDRNEVSLIKAGYGYGRQQVRNALQVNQRGIKFSDIAPFNGIHATDWSWAPLMADFNNDGELDVYITNGIARRPNDLDYIQYLANTSRSGQEISDIALIEKMPELKISNYMYAGMNTDVTTDWGFDMESFSNGSAYADLDNDGDLDLVVNNINQPAFIFNNQSVSPDASWLKLQLDATGSNGYAVGAQVSAYVAGKEYYSMISPTRGFMSSVAPEIHIGLGQSKSIDSLIIWWPDRTTQVIKGMIEVDTLLQIQQNSSMPISTNLECCFADESKRLGLVDVRHEENLEYQDFKREHLIPENLSMEGPGVAVGDVNGDGYSDIFLGSSHGLSSRLFVFDEGTFKEMPSLTWVADAGYEDTDAAFFDADGDGDLDLYVVSGGNQYPEGHPILEDRLYLNDGKGTFGRANGLMPELAGNGAVVRPFDIDNDGDLDLFVGQRSVPGAYGRLPESFILLNNGGSFELDAAFRLPAMITDAVWGNTEGTATLYVVGDWMSVTIMRREGQTWTKQEVDQTVGLWRSIALTDLNSDGNMDLIVGNIGLNTSLSSGNPDAGLFVGDFDGNGQMDPIIFQQKGEELIPFASKDDIEKQLPVLKKSFTDYSAYAAADDLPGYFRELAEADEYWIDTFAHLKLIRENNGWKAEQLAGHVQWTQIDDIEMDGNSIFLSGNSYRPNVNLGRIDAVSLLEAEVQNNEIQFNSSEVSTGISGDLRGVHKLNCGEWGNYLLIIRNNDSIQVLKAKD